MHRKILVFALMCSLLLGCARTAKVLTIRDLAFDRNPRLGYTVFIEEGGFLVPYLVLTDNYNGHTLLLRKEPLDEERIYNDNSGLVYFADSLMDVFLNGEFFAVLNPAVQEQVIESHIRVTNEAYWQLQERATETIVRRVFLLSCTEVGIDLSFVPKEGQRLRYFKNVPNRIAYNNGEPWVWFLRTPYFGQSTLGIWVIGPQGVGGGKGVAGFFPESGVRPAFCLPGSVPIELQAGPKAGQLIYVIRR